ncbi:MAG: DUF4179 domain-containing protein [Cellulosilyticaceae bacterium]
MEKQYQKELEQIHLTEEGKRMLVQKLSKNSVRDTKAIHTRRFVGIAATILCVILISVTTSAIGFPIVQAYLGGKGYEQSGTTLGKSVTKNDWTLTLTDCVGDDRYLYLGIEVEAPKGIVLGEEAYRIEDFDIDFEGLEDYAMAYQFTQVEDDNKEDNIIRFIFWIQGGYYESSFNNRYMDLKLKNISYRNWDTTGEAYEDLYACEEEWRFKRIPIRYPDNRIQFEPNTVVKVLDIEETLTKVEVTPIGIVAIIEGDNLKGHHEWVDKDESGSPDCWGEDNIKLYDKEGKLLEPDRMATPFGVRASSGCWGGVKGSDEDGKLKLVQSYGYLLDMSELGYVEVYGEKLNCNE